MRFFFGDLLTSSSMLTLGNVQENLTLRSLTRIGVHEAMVLVLRLVDAILASDGVNRHEWLVQSLVETGDGLPQVIALLDYHLRLALCQSHRNR